MSAGATARVLEAILTVHAELRGTVFELPPTATVAVRGADAYLVSDILHDWDDVHARAILTRCARAAEPHGSVMVIEPILGQGVDTAMDLFMLMCFGGMERTLDELVRLAGECRLVLRESVGIAEGRALLAFGVSANDPRTD